MFRNYLREQAARVDAKIRSVTLLPQTQRRLSTRFG
jgi:hypothetical protein